MEQILVNNNLQNIKNIHHMYGVTNAQRRRGFLQQFSLVLSRCNTLLIHAPLGEELLDIHSQLDIIISQLQCQSYRYSKMRQLRGGLIDHQC